ncbi:hypothetical protein EJB05_25495 [Eragrostis curvula]|uniref:DUF6598 domain-containing protein n=1 Tax=Eragrostis curvula TaxID=38414 RepID=A0A5J9VC56_9POAL|nr:hypothetical protein EJB05_25495 [Eragrostis curvula]
MKKPLVEICWIEHDMLDITTGKLKKGYRILLPEDSDIEEYNSHEAFWEDILGVKPRYWTGNTDKVSESNRSLLDEALKNEAKYEKDTEDYLKRIDELNGTDSDSDSEGFTEVTMLPRSPSPRCFHLWHQWFRMTNTNPTFLTSKLLTAPQPYEYISQALLQFKSMRFAGDLPRGQTLKVHGFVAVRDDIDRLRNYIFNRSQEHAQEITQDSPDLWLTSPARGITAVCSLLVEYSLKVVKISDKSGEEEEVLEEVLVDGCFMFEQGGGQGSLVVLHTVRLFNPIIGPFDLRFIFLRYAVEATVEVKVKRAVAGYSLTSVTAATCGCGSREEIVLPMSAAAVPPPDRVAALSSSVVAVAKAVVAVELGCQLKLKFEITTTTTPSSVTRKGSGGGGGGRRSSSSQHELFFTSRKHHEAKGAVVMGRMFKVEAKVTWSTMGTVYIPFLHRERSLLGDPDNPCSFSSSDDQL